MPGWDSCAVSSPDPVNVSRLGKGQKQLLWVHDHGFSCHAGDDFDQLLGTHGLGQVIIHAGSQAALAVASQGVGSHGDNRNVIA